MFVCIKIYDESVCTQVKEPEVNDRVIKLPETVGEARGLAKGSLGVNFR
jgi:hypothetical protein